MEARTCNINNVIQRNTLLRIPYFQRRYVWTEEDWKRFALDMESTLDSERYYFLGAIILKEERVSMEDRRNGISKRYLVVDGQQRLTTLSIFMKVLHMMVGRNSDFENQYLQANDRKEPVIIHSCEDMPQFREIMHLATPAEIADDSNIAKAYDFFRKFLEARRNVGVSLNDLLNMVNANITFVNITLDSNDDEQQIFDTINSLGVPLTTGELMKNFLYGADDEESYRTSWKPIFDTDEAKEFWDADASSSRQAKSKDNSTIERFFHAFVRIKMWDFREQLAEHQRKNFVKVENVFATCKAFVDVFGMSKQELANEILAYARLFKAHLNDDILDSRIPQHAGIKRISCIINATGSYTVIPYVLYILRTQALEAERNNIFGYLETYLVRRMLVKSSNNNYSDLFSENLIGRQINSYEALKTYIKEKGAERSLAMPTDEAVMMHTRKNRLDENTARVILYLYETKLSQTADNTFTHSFNTCFAEQFMPRPSVAANKNWCVYEDQEQEQRRIATIPTLGNYFLLKICNDKGLRKYRNDGFDRKLSLFQQWSRGVRSSQLLVNNCRCWNEKEITNRTDILTRGFCREIWSLN